VSGLPIDAVIFDMDGVLLDSEPLHLDAINSVLATEGQHLSHEQNEAYLGTTLLHTWRDMHARFGLRRDLEHYLAIYDAEVLRRLRQPLRPNPGVPELIALLRARDLRMAVASSSQRTWIDATLASLGLADALGIVVSGDAVAHGKPAPDIFLRAAELVGVAPDRCLAIEDAPNGVLAAQRAGMRVVAVRTHFTRRLDLGTPDYTVDSLEVFPQEALA
jgi:HAD superfamily hydrolase (TIGR01509 family)